MHQDVLLQNGIFFSRLKRKTSGANVRRRVGVVLWWSNIAFTTCHLVSGARCHHSVFTAFHIINPLSSGFLKENWRRSFTTDNDKKFHNVLKGQEFCRFETNKQKHWSLFLYVACWKPKLQVTANNNVKMQGKKWPSLSYFSFMPFKA